MIHHTVMWKFKDNLDDLKQRKIVDEFERRLLEVMKQTQGVDCINLVFPVQKTSNMDLMLLSVFETKDALDKYQNHSLHQEAVLYLKEYVVQRSCVDY